MAIKLKKPFSKKPKRTETFFCKMTEETSKKFTFLKKHERKAKTAILEDLIHAGYDSVRKG